MFFGRIIGTLIGLAVGNLFFAIIGFIAGFVFDQGFKKAQLGMGQVGTEERVKIERALFQAIFPLLGRLSKSDGRISEEEIATTEHLMTRMGLSQDDRNTAIDLFKQGAESSFDIDACIEQFLSVCGRYNNLKQMFLVYMITIAFADGQLHQEEEKLLQHVADKLGYSRFAFNHLVGMIKAQSEFHRKQHSGGNYSSGTTSQNDLELAYRVLGVSKDVGESELKRAYRKLMSEYHPDKLAGRGATEDMVKVATERSQEIQAAYELIKKQRKNN